MSSATLKDHPLLIQDLPNSRGKLTSLTSIRFFAALGVFLSHLSYLENSTTPWVKALYDRVFSQGYIGVGFFFILSGFILSHAYHSRFVSGIGRLEIIKFYTARFARIYPLHLLTAMAMLPLVFFIGQMNSFSELATGAVNLLLLQSHIPVKTVYFSLNAPSWSISNEAFFYLLFPPLFIFALRRSKHFLLIFFVAFISILIGTFIFPHGSVAHFLWYIWPVSRIADFLVGILAFIFRGKILKIMRNHSIIQIISLSFILSSVVFHSYIPQALLYDAWFILPFSTLVISLSSGRGIMNEILSNKYLVYLGEISFGFYMFHVVILRYLAPFRDTQFASAFYPLAAFFITLTLSALSFKYYESPLSSKINKAILARFVGEKTLLSS